MASAPEESRASPIPLSGVLCRGEWVELGWPEEHELDALTALRNRPLVRQRFLDPRALDPVANREWLRSGMRRPDEAVLAMRLRSTGVLCGMLGWSRWDRHERSLELGRLIVDAQAVLRAGSRVHARRHLAVDAAIALRDYAFQAMQLAVIRTVYIADNAHAARVNHLAGGRIVGRTREVRRDGREVDLIRIEMTREEWHASRGGANP